jgi:3-deoxy-D-manno-octulosonate 8-phosphate phosphatase (KDO 8-P phosphatase)
LPSLALNKIRLFVMDVDGVLTDGRITYDSRGEELKSFDIRDGLGIKLLQRAGLKTAIITGRISPMVERRAAELSIEWVIQGREDKLQALKSLATEVGLDLDEIAYIGDDLPDLSAIQSVGLGIAVADADERVLRAAGLVTKRSGGRGAVREASEWLLSQTGKLNAVLAGFEKQS